MKVEEIETLFETKTITTEIYLPSSKQTIKVNQMDVEDFKLICKINMIESDDISDSLISDLVLIKKLTNDTIDIDTIDEVDFTILLAHIRNNNFFDDMGIIVPCSNKECTHSTEHNINLDLIENWTSENIEQKIQFTDDITLFVGPPKIMDMIYIEKKYDNNETEIFSYILDKIISYIKEVYYKDELLEDYLELNLDQKINLLQKLGIDPNALVKRISSDEILSSTDIFYEITCPKCKTKMKVFADYNNFFLI